MEDEAARGGKPATLDFWFDFASTYSYLSAMRIEQAAKAAGVEVRWRPFLLGPIFRAQGWDSSPFTIYEAKGRYMWRDMERLAKAEGLAFVRPDPFPQPSLLAARAALTDVVTPRRAGFCRELFLAEFAEGLAIDEPGTVARVAERTGVDAGAVLAGAAEGDVKERLKAQTAEAQALGIFGAPSFVTAQGELFWGNDRLDQALAWAATLAQG